MLDRHNLAWLSEEGWQCAIDRAAATHRDAIAAWARADWPAIVRRADADAGINEACLGIALPPNRIDGSKTRIALRVPRSTVKKSTLPIPLSSAVEAAPRKWRAQLAVLESRASGQGLSLKVYGSLALQALTGQAYMTPASDIDVLLCPVTIGQLQAGLDVLSSMSEVLPLDGELVFPSREAVAWKEWRAAVGTGRRARVLVKGMRSVHLSTPDALLSTLMPSCLH